MAAEWYYRSSAGDEKGPVTAQKLKELALFGLIDPETGIRKGTEGHWIVASKVKGLLDLQAPNTTSAKAPPADRGLHAPVGTGTQTTSPTQEKAAPLVRKPAPQATSGGEEVRHVPARRPAPGDVIDAEFTVTQVGRRRSPFVYVGAGVGGTLIAVGLAVLLLSYFSKKDENDPLQQPVAHDTNVRQKPESPAVQEGQSTASSTAAIASVSTPEATVKSYLAVPTWEERLPYVLNADRVRSKMAEAYKYTPGFKPENFLPGTILSVENRDAPLGGRCSVTVDVSISSPDLPKWTYILIRTSDGFKVDWEASQERGKKDQDKVIQARLRELNPVLDVEVLRCKQSHSRAEFELKITNQSTVLLSYMAVTLSISSTKNAYLGNGFTNSTNVPAGQSIVKSISFDNVHVDDVASWKLAIKDVTIDKGDGRPLESTTLFKMNQIPLGGMDKKYHTRMESCLLGRHWTGGRGIDWYFSASEPIAVSVTPDKGARKVIYGVVERNYTAGSFNIRYLLPDNTDFQFTIKIHDQDTLKLVLTHARHATGDWFEVDDDIKQVVNTWTYVDDKERP